jgi:hypothetical protein
MANREDRDGTNHPYGDDGHADIDEAKQKLIEAIDRVVCAFFSRLQFLISHF